MAFDPIKQGATELFDPIAQGAVALEEPADLLEPVIAGEKRIDDLLPPREQEQFGAIAGLADNPEQERENITNTMYFANQYAADPNDVSMFLDDIIGKTHFNPTKSEPEQRGFFGKIAESWRRGDAQVMADIAVFETAFEGRGNETKALAYLKKLQLKQMLDPIEGNFMAELVYSGVEILPGMLRGYWSAVPAAFVGMAGGAAMALAAGQVPPLTLAPEEVVTVPAGAALGTKLGFMSGSALFWYKQGAGSMYATMRENDYDPEISRHIAGAAAIPYAIVEFLQVARLTPGIRQGALNIAQRSMLKVVGNAVKEYGTTWGIEVFEEVVQEIIQIVAEDTAGFLSDKLKLPEGVSKFLIERGQRLWLTTKEAGKAMALLPIPGATIDIYTGKRAIVEKKPEIKPVEPAPEVIETPPVTPVEPITPEKPAVVLPEPVEIKPEIEERPPEPGFVPEEEKVAGVMTEAKQKTLVREFTKEIQEHEVYQSELAGIDVSRREIDVGYYYVEPELRGEVLQVTGKPFAKGFKPALYRMFTFKRGRGATGWDVAAAERGITDIDIDEFVRRVAEALEAKKKKAGLNVLALQRAKESGNLSFELLTEKLDWIKEGLSTERINQNIIAWARDYEISEEDIAGELIPTEEEVREIRLAPAEEAEIKRKVKWYRTHIHILAAQKGLGKQTLSDIKMKYGGARQLVGKLKSMPLEKLEAVYGAVRRARPRRIGYKRVITRKTETKIQSLKESLTAKTAMTEADYTEILQKEVHGKEPRYINAKRFITETEGKDIIKRMLDEAEVIRVTEGYEKAIRGNSEIQEQVKKLDRRIKEKPKRDPYSLESMRHYNQQAEVKTGAPFYAMYMDLIDTHLDSIKTRAATWKRLENTISKRQFKLISGDEAALQRVTDYIASQSTLKEKPAMPTDITEAEVKLAKEIQGILKDYRLKVRVAKFFNFYFYNQPIPEHDRYRKEITKAVDIFEGKGREELIEYLDTQEWGVIRSGYEPLEVLIQKVRPYTTGATTVGKGHIKIRTDIEYHTQERNILQRLSSYMRQVDMLYNMSPKINAYVRMFDDNMDKFTNPNIVKENIETFLRNLKRYNIQGGMFERALSRMYSQAMRVIIMPSPVLSFRNLFQNAAFEHDKSILIDTRNKPLSNARIEYLETFVMQTRAMIEEYFMISEKPLWGLRFLTKMIDRIKIYPHSDMANRHWSFWAKINQVDRALEAKTTSEMMKEARFEDITELEQRRALAILARDGKEAMARYVSRVHVDDIHFLYERTQRSPAEMTPLGKVVGNLFLFPRAYGEKLAHAANKMLKGKTTQEQWRGLKILFSVIAGGMLVGAIYQKVTRRKRNPYNPLEILAFRPGGLAWGSVEAVTEIYVNILSAAKGDSRALAALTVAIPRAADMFIPFYDYTLRGIEAATDQKNVDRKVLRQIRMMIDKEYHIRGGAYKVRRNALEKWQYFIAGAGVDQKKKGPPTLKR